MTITWARSIYDFSTVSLELMQTGRRLMLWQAILLMAPPTIALPLVPTALAAGIFGVSAEIARATIPMVVICFLPLLAGWRLTLAFIFGDSRGLKEVGFIWWLLAALGVLLLITSAYVMVSEHLTGQSFGADALPSEENPFGLGPPKELVFFCTRASLISMPLILPFVYLVHQRRNH